VPLTDAEMRRMAMRTLPTLFTNPNFIQQRRAYENAATSGVVALSTDLYWDVVEKTRRFAGWVVVFVADLPPSGTGRGGVQIREFLPRQEESGDPRTTPNMTIGEAFALLERAERAGIDIFKERNDISKSFAAQHPVR
jgi:hypothetical protein